MDRCLRVGLSGGIGSGKSEVSRRFEALGVPVYDADLISRELVAPGQPALEAIARRFGPALLHADGRLDRAMLRERVFRDDQARQDLQRILHPLVRARLLHAADACGQGYCIFSVPLLLEAGFADLVDRILMIDVSPALQRQRASLRDGVSQQQIESIMRTQVERLQRLQAANDIIDNSGDLAGLDAQVRALHSLYLDLAARPGSGQP